MKFNFKKILSVIGSVFLVGATLGMANAISPAPFVKDNVVDFAIVYGANSAPSDLTASNKINNHLLSFLDSNIEIVGNFSSIINSTIISNDFSDSTGITENEVVLGTEIANNGKLKYVLTDNQVPSLIDGEIYFDDGTESKTTYNVHEEILLGKMGIITTLDDDDLNETSLTNNKDLEYRYVFEETLDINRIGHEDADTLEINILGIEYEVNSFDSDSITVSSSKREILSNGESIVVDGKIIKVEDIFLEMVQINGELIREGRTETVDGLEVKIEEIAYHSSGTSPSKVIIVVGKDILTTYNNGGEYPGQDDEDPLWVWNIEDPGVEGGWIGVSYDQRELDSDDNLVYAGGSYDFPNNYASVQFDGLTNVEYNEFEVYFDGSQDLYEKNSDNIKMSEDAQVAVLKGPNDDSFLIDGEETDKIYLYNNISTGMIDLFYSDVNKDFSDSVKARYSFSLDINGGDIGTLVNEDVELDISINNESVLSIGELSIVLNSDFEYLGLEEENAEDDEVIFSLENVGEKEEDLLNHFGLILYNPEDNAEDDTVVFGVPSEQVFAEVSVLGQGEEVTLESDSESDTTIPQIGSIILTDTEVASFTDKNLIVVGGSCINKVAAGLLGVAENTCGEAFTTATGVGNGQAWIQEYVSPYNNEKIALLVAGYTAEDTTAAIDSLITAIV